MAGLIHWAKACILQEYHRWVLWIPVGLGMGAALYFSLSTEPFKLFGSLLIGGFISLYWGIRSYTGRHPHWLIPFVVILAGFTGAQFRTLSLDIHLLSHKIKDGVYLGTIKSIEHQEDGVRMILEDVKGDKSFSRIRVTLKETEGRNLHPGQKIQFQGVLLPPGEPVVPGGFDFRRMAYFDGIQGVGYIDQSQVPIRIIEEASGSWVQSLRHSINEKLKGLGGQTGAIATALITGDKAGLSKETRDEYANSGLAHVLAISGLHLSIVAGLVFLVLRGGLSLLPGIAIHYPIKKWAAVVAIVATAFYLAISGFGYPAQRSFIMTAVVLGAILVDRTALSMRSVALAASILLLLRPESILTASFQLSFAAVVALIAVYESMDPLRERLLNHQEREGWLRAPFLYFLGIVLTTLVATLATTPFTIGIFQKFTLQSVVSNMVAIPLVAFWIMPWGVVSVLGMMVGLEEVPLYMMGQGIDLLTWVASEISTWPGANVQTPPPGPFYFPLIALGGLWLALWKGPWRYWGAVPIVVGIGTLGLYTPPDLVLAREGPMIGIPMEGDKLWVSNPRIKPFVSDAWLRHFPGRELSLDPFPGCKDDICQYSLKAHTLIWSEDRKALTKWCRGELEPNTIVVSLKAFKGKCPRAETFLTSSKLWNKGGAFMWENDSLIWEFSRDGSRRPWSVEVSKF